MTSGFTLASVCLCAALFLGAAAVSPDQATMVQFVSPIVSSCGGKFPFAASTSADVCTWQGITCNSENFVTEIQFPPYEYYGCTGVASLNTLLLPPKLKIFVLVFDTQWEDYNYNFFFGGALSFAPESLLEKIVVTGNRFTSIDLTRLPSNLIWLDVSQNLISSPATLTNIPSTLMYIYLHENSFTGTLDLTSLPPLLQDFSAYGNKITTVVVPAALPALIFGQTFDMHNNMLTSIVGPAGGINSTQVNLRNNSLVESSFSWTVFSKNVRTIALDYNSMSTLDLTSIPAGLQTLTVTYNVLRSVVAAGGNPSLFSLDVSGNLLQTFPWTQLPIKLQSLSVNNNLLSAVDLSSLPQTLENIGNAGTSLAFTGNVISSIKFPAAFSTSLSMCTIDLSYQRFTSFDFTKVPTQVVALSLNNNQIASVTFPANSATSMLTSLDLSYNQLTGISWELLPHGLATLNLQYNQLTQADFSKLPAGLASFPNQGELSLVGNMLSDVIFGQLPVGITSVDLSAQRISVITFGGGNKLVSFVNLSANFITSQNLHLSNLPVALTQLDVSNNNLTVILCEHLPTTLSVLHARHNQITSVVFALDGQLTEAQLGHNQIPTLGLSTIPASLTILNVENNRISSLTGAMVPNSFMQILVLDFNLLQTVPFTSLSQDLIELHLRGNQLNVPFNTWIGHFKQLRGLDVSQNRLGPVFSFANVPSTLQTLMVNGNGYTGPLDLSNLPSSLYNLGIAYNSFTGSFPTKSGYLEVLLASHNSFTGSLESTQAWGGYLDLGYNQLSGSLNFSTGNWPETLLLPGNKFSGVLDLSNTYFLVADLSNNDFTGTPVLSEYGEDCNGCVVDLNNTNICGTTAPSASACGNIIIPSRCKIVTTHPTSYETACEIVCPSC